MNDRILTINQASLLRDLLRGVERDLKLRYYPFGGERVDLVRECVLRAFTHAEGALYPRDKDIRDAHAWTSGITEHWFKVSDLLVALDNIDGNHGEDKPIAIIETDKE